MYMYVRAGAVMASSSASSAKLRFLTWNIDGLDEYELPKRTEAICDIICCEKPDVVVLQEVVDASLTVLISRLGGDYHLVAPNSSMYYTAILTRNTTCDSSSSKMIAYNYPNTRMDRDLLVLTNIVMHATQHRVALMTSHLESLREGSQERMWQLAFLYKEMEAACKQHDVVIFGGDTNLRAAEVKECPAPLGILNAWQECACPADAKVTFDKANNVNIIRKGWPGPAIQTQYDKVFFTNSKVQSSGRGPLKPTTFRLIGKEKILKDSVPSDHYGIICDFI